MAQENEQNTKLSTSKTDKFQFILALVIVIPFVVYVGIFHAYNLTQEAKDILAMLGAFVGTIVGFYFGQRPVQNLTQQVASVSSQNQTLRSTSAEATNIASDIMDSDKEVITNLKNQVKVLKETIASLKRPTR